MITIIVIDTTKIEEINNTVWLICQCRTGGKMDWACLYVATMPAFSIWRPLASLMNLADLHSPAMEAHEAVA